MRVSLPYDKKDSPDSVEYLPMTASAVNIFILKFCLKILSRTSRTPPQNINCRELWVLDNIFHTQIFITVFIAWNIFSIILYGNFRNCKVFRSSRMNRSSHWYCMKSVQSVQGFFWTVFGHFSHSVCDILWKMCSFLTGAHIKDIGWPILNNKIILTIECFFPRSFYQR